MRKVKQKPRDADYEKALEIAKIKGYDNILSMLQVSRTLYRAFHHGKNKNVELLIDIKSYEVDEVEEAVNMIKK